MTSVVRTCSRILRGKLCIDCILRGKKFIDYKAITSLSSDNTNVSCKMVYLISGIFTGIIRMFGPWWKLYESVRIVFWAGLSGLGGRPFTEFCFQSSMQIICLQCLIIEAKVLLKHSLWNYMKIICFEGVISPIHWALHFSKQSMNQYLTEVWQPLFTYDSQNDMKAASIVQKNSTYPHGTVGTTNTQNQGRRPRSLTLDEDNSSWRIFCHVSSPANAEVLLTSSSSAS